jgi:arsenate reductase-like glutaredoxin family protein
LLDAGGQGAVEERELGSQPMSAQEIDLLIGQNDHHQFLNTRNELYRKRDMRARPPARDEAVKRMAREPNLIRRPLLVRGGEIVYGFDADAYCKALQKR